MTLAYIEGNYRSVLCLNGDLPGSSFFLSCSLPVIAADGAANRLHQLGIRPNIVIGDLDSVNTIIRQQNKVLHCPEQDSNDFQKSIQYLREKALLPSIVLGINGGFLDHVLNNINIFLETGCVLYSPPIVGYILKENYRKAFSLPFNTKISLLGIPSAIITSKGLKWELNESRLSFPGNTSCFNRTRESSIELSIHQGALLVLIYTEASSDAGSL
ncbi:thiamine diphosphokinase [Legionella israelensis]|uniref:Thiamine diphosphokinase n=1 Tax=Legionella israelensis TaxID=454 RepID=A0AAX1EF50_9GAMM|nr:thiamine diphosphokinase [Legionella israelensis]QBR83721.1 thiamine diphosphokinase [Legionella israelensis]